jgi:hypothetical protein
MRTIQMSTVCYSTILDRIGRPLSWPLSVGQSVHLTVTPLSSTNKLGFRKEIGQSVTRKFDRRPRATSFDRIVRGWMYPAGVLWFIVCLLSIGQSVRHDELLPQKGEFGIGGMTILYGGIGVIDPNQRLIYIQLWRFGCSFVQQDQTEPAFWVAVRSCTFRVPFLFRFCSFPGQSTGIREAALSRFSTIRKLSFSSPFLVCFGLFCPNSPYSVPLPGCPAVRKDTQKKRTTYPVGIGMTPFGRMTSYSISPLIPTLLYSFFVALAFFGPRAKFSEREFLCLT